MLLKKREAEAEADPQFYAAPGVAVAQPTVPVSPFGLPVAQPAEVVPALVQHNPILTTTTTKVSQTCQEVTQQHCIKEPVTVDEVSYHHGF